MGLPLFMRIPGNGSSLWAGSTITANDGLNPAEIWDYDAELGLAQASGYDVAEDFRGWMADAGRAWSGTRTFDAAVTYAEHSNGAQGTWSFGWSGGTITFTNSAAIQALLGVPASSGAVADYECEAVVGSVGGLWETANWLRSSKGQEGGAASAGGWMSTGTATNPKRPTLVGVLNNGEMLALSLAKMYTRAPQEAHVYETQASTWHLVSVGALNPDSRSAGPLLTRVAGRVLG